MHQNHPGTSSRIFHVLNTTEINSEVNHRHHHHHHLLSSICHLLNLLHDTKSLHKLRQILEDKIKGVEVVIEVEEEEGRRGGGVEKPHRRS